jgi:hypothetical protein
MQPSPIDIKRLRGVALSALVAFVTSYSLPDEAIKDPQLSNALITIFSVFAGFMIALMAVTSHLHEAKSWKSIAVSREVIEARLFRQQLLFYGYLSTLALIVVSILVGYYSLWSYSDIVSEYVGRLYIFVGTLSLLLSFSLPASLRTAHEKTINEQLKNAKQSNSGGQNDSRI